jgi:hypothetical protein
MKIVEMIVLIEGKLYPLLAEYFNEWNNVVNKLIYIVFVDVHSF